jgi:GTP-binding protein EngB required for normal cell division
VGFTRFKNQNSYQELKAMFGLRKNKAPIRLVVGLNQVDKIVANGWNERMNMPEERAAKEIARRCNDLTQRLAKYADISTDNIEYYSALKRYRLLPLLTKIVSNAYAGFKLDNVQPADPFELADPEVKAFADQQRREREAKKSSRTSTDKDRMFEEMKKILSEDDLNLVLDKFRQERSLPPKVAIFGKAGVGKTTTINSLFNAKWKTSHTIVGTTSAQMKEFELSTGGTLSVVDLPGYGRSLAEDREYEKIYQDTIPSCDLVLLIVQADAKDLADDEEMILKVAEWLKDSPKPQR